MTEPATWVDAYGDRLFRYALSRVRDGGSAEDLIQDTFVTALKSRDRFKGDSSELTWMTGILRNKIFEYYRRQAKETPLRPLDEESGSEQDFFDGRHWSVAAAPRDWGGEPAKSAESAEFAAALRRCLDALTEKVAGAFILREMEGVAADEVAGALGVPPGHLAVLLYRARMRLRSCLEKNHFAPEGA
ncbi:MAG: RNA polymerase subunit sigma [Elusimicrobia bacterium CG11_big_fil_rev_8_21_14_0_20_64_6]|nr:MAG: RNA polymerase subunit sigma [Elusimicrobia bacterium CG11_big_fil_rev_8_21_14_0_20_64_6]